MTRGSWLAFVGLAIFTMGTSIVTPLFPLYAEQFNLSAGTITLLFATYTATVVPTMLIAGNLSDMLGRKRLILPAMATITAASLVFGFTTSVTMLFAGRILQGLAIGMFLGVGAAFVVDHARPERRELAAQVAGVGFRLGFGLGPGLAGILAQYASDPIHRPFHWHALLMVVAILAIVFAPETLPRRRGLRFAIRVGVPPGQFRGFATFIAPAGFLMSFFDATLLSLVPLYMVDTLGTRNLALVGLVGFLVLGAGAFTPLIFRGLPPRRAMITGVVASTCGSLLVVAAAGVGTVALVIVAAGIIGFTNGLILQGATSICSLVVPANERGKLVSALYMCCYAGTVPSVALGYLSRGIGLTATMAVFSAAAACLASFVLLVGRRNFREVVVYQEPSVREGAMGVA
jgi:MFS family permease